MRVELVVDRSGEPELIPDDCFSEFGTPVSRWLGGAFARVPWQQGETALRMSERCAAYLAAYGIYEQAAARAYKGGDPLRIAPWVIPEYDSTNEGSLKFLFIFKAENNGNTYRVRYTPENE